MHGPKGKQTTTSRRLLKRCTGLKTSGHSARRHSRNGHPVESKLRTVEGMYRPKGKRTARLHGSKDKQATTSQKTVEDMHGSKDKQAEVSGEASRSGLRRAGVDVVP